MSADPKVLDKIKKCLALSSSDSPHEAASAMARAQELMAKHGISAEQLASTDERVAYEVVEEGVRSIATASRAKDWELRLFRAVATVFGCDLLFKRGVPRYVIAHRGLPVSEQFATYLFIGTKHEALMARYAAEVLLKQLARQRAEFTRTLPTSWTRPTKTAEVDTYCHGWVEGASEKVRPLAQVKVEEAAKVSQSHALVVQTAEEKRLAAIREYIERNTTGRVGSNRRAGGSYQAMEQGYRDGSRASVHRALGGSDPKSRAIKQ